MGSLDGAGAGFLFGSDSYSTIKTSKTLTAAPTLKHFNFTGS